MSAVACAYPLLCRSFAEAAHAVTLLEVEVGVEVGVLLVLLHTASQAAMIRLQCAAVKTGVLDTTMLLMLLLLAGDGRPPSNRRRFPMRGVSGLDG
jgi:hypothetical protein